MFKVDEEKMNHLQRKKILRELFLKKRGGRGDHLDVV